MRAFAIVFFPAFLAASAVAAQEPMATPPQGMGRDMMTQMDSDKDGVLSRDEFIKGHVRADAYFARLDVNKDGAVSREEFLAEPAGPRRSARFDMIDANHDGKLTADEVGNARAAMKRQKPGGS